MQAHNLNLVVGLLPSGEVEVLSAGFDRRAARAVLATHAGDTAYTEVAHLRGFRVEKARRPQENRRRAAELREAQAAHAEREKLAAQASVETLRQQAEAALAQASEIEAAHGLVEAPAKKKRTRKPKPQPQPTVPEEAPPASQPSPVIPVANGEFYEGEDLLGD